MHENQTTPPSRSQNGCLNFGTKSDLMTVLETDINLPGAEPKANAFINDGAALINEKSPGTVRTFDDYAKYVIIPTLQSYSRHYYRTDIVFDQIIQTLWNCRSRIIDVLISELIENIRLVTEKVKIIECEKLNLQRIFAEERDTMSMLENDQTIVYVLFNKLSFMFYS